MLVTDVLEKDRTVIEVPGKLSAPLDHLATNGATTNDGESKRPSRRTATRTPVPRDRSRWRSPPWRPASGNAQERAVDP
ncbi:hypothetical protein [Streptomyces dysideae]|uniref:hypothetical protein n=1 Tax=Streptomyces dysideae TaxID=909626 RepID=UPI00131C37FD|nr:hypothetical protein [Streptomyces dysideae]